MSKLFTYILIFGLWIGLGQGFTSFAQTSLPSSAAESQPEEKTDSTNTNGLSKITGLLVDSTSGKPVEFATIALIDPQTGKPVDGTTSDGQGRFTLPNVKPGTYRLQYSSIGYRSRTSTTLAVAAGNNQNTGPVKLAADVRTLNEVVVTGQAALIEEKVDRLVYNADKDIMAKGGNAGDVLRKVPLLTVDLDGNVSLRGSQNIRVLINNKPSTIIANSVSDALKQIPADQIKTVEVITSPSARYDAEGSGGIINIITKKNTLQGFNLNVESAVGNRGAQLSLNGGYRQGKAGFTLGGFGFANYNTPTQSNLDQTSQVNGVTTLTRQTGNGQTSGLFAQYNLGFDYDLAKDQSLTAGIRYGLRNQLNRQQLMTQLFTDGVAGPTSLRNVDSKNLSGTIDANVDYLHTFSRGEGRPQAEWSISTLYSRNDLTNNFDADLLTGTSVLTGRQRNLNKNLNQEFTLQTDYQTPIRKNQSLEVGLKGIFRQVNSAFSYLLAGPTGGFTTENNDTQGELLYHQTIAAGYASYTYSTNNKYTLKGGFRYERTLIDATNQQGTNLGIADYGVLVPSINVAKTFKATTVKLGYNRRIQRPGLQQLNPNFNAANPQNITIGNPTLRPELTDNVEVSLSKTIKKTVINATFFGRMTNNAIVQVSNPSDTLPGAIVTTFQNIGRQQAYGTNLFTNVAVTSKISIGLFLNAFYASLTGQTLGIDGQSITLTNSGVTLSGGLFGSAQLGCGWGVQGFGFTRGTQVQLQGRQGGFGFYSVGVKKDFTNKKGSIGLSTENFLSSRFHIRTDLTSPQFSQVNDMYFYNRGVRLTFSYKLGRLSTDVRAKRTKSVTNDDVKVEENGNGQQQSSGSGGRPR